VIGLHVVPSRRCHTSKTLTPPCVSNQFRHSVEKHIAGRPEWGSPSTKFVACVPLRGNEWKPRVLDCQRWNRQMGHSGRDLGSSRIGIRDNCTGVDAPSCRVVANSPLPLRSAAARLTCDSHDVAQAKTSRAFPRHREDANCLRRAAPGSSCAMTGDSADRVRSDARSDLASSVISSAGSAASAERYGPELLNA